MVLIQSLLRLFDQYSELTDEQLEKAINSHANQAAKHQSYLNGPVSHVPNWESLSAQHQENLTLHWRQDISRHEAYSDIAEAILNQRQREVPTNGW